MDGKSILVTGASGVLGWFLCRHLSRSGIPVIGTYRSNRPNLPGVSFEPLALEDTLSVATFCRDRSFAAIVHAGAISNPDHCEKNRELARAVNVEGTRALIENLPPDSIFVYISTDLVFDGTKGMYREEDAPSPINYYGETKLEAERLVLGRHNAVVVRIGKLYSSGSPFHPCFVTWMRERFECGERVPLFEDQYRTPIYVGDIARALEIVAHTEPRAILYHLGGPERQSRLDFGRAFAAEFGYDEKQIDPILSVKAGLTQRGRDCSLDSSRFYRDYDFKPYALEEGLRKLRLEWETCG